MSDRIHFVRPIVAVALLLICVACSAEHPSSQESATKLDGPIFVVQSIPGTAEGKTRGIRQLFLNRDEELFGWEIDVPEGDTDSQSGQGTLIGPLNSGKIERRNIITGASISNLIIDKRSHSAIGVEAFPRLVADGSLHVRSRKFQVDLHSFQTQESAFTTVEYPDQHDNARHARKLIREAYINSYLRSQPLTLFETSSGPKVLLDFMVELGMLNPSTHLIQSVLPMDLESEQSQAIACTEDQGTSDRLIVQSKNSALIARITHQPRTAFQDQQLYVLRVNPEQIVVESSFKTADLGVAASSSLSIASCKTAGERIYIAGSKYSSRTGVRSLWLAKVNNDKILTKTYSGSLNVFPRAIEVNEDAGLVFAMGESDFAWASTGSAGVGLGFVFQADLSLNAIHYDRFLGFRSTRVLAAYPDFRNSSLWVAGTTNAPSTHDSNLSSESFVNKIPLGSNKE